jgi:long-chain acyl-CoA synthetase
VAVPILADFTNEGLQDLTHHSESKVLFTEARKWEALNPEKMPHLIAAINIDDFSLLYAATDAIKEAYDKRDEAFAKAYPKGFRKGDMKLALDELDELMVINYTSGTTGSPKGIMLTGRNITANIEFALNKIPVPQEATMMSMLPMAHMYGLAFEFLYPFCGGAHVTFLGKTPSPTVLMAAFQEVKPYILITVPLVMEKVIKGKVMPVLKKPAMQVLTKIPVLKNVIYKSCFTKSNDVLSPILRLCARVGF